MAARKRVSAARGRGRGKAAMGQRVYDPTARILDQYRGEYEAFEHHQYADAPMRDRFGRSTAILPFRGQPEASGEAFNPLKTLGHRR